LRALARCSLDLPQANARQGGVTHSPEIGLLALMLDVTLGAGADLCMEGCRLALQKGCLGCVACYAFFVGWSCH
jgi:hypothetical protein